MPLFSWLPKRLHDRWARARIYRRREITALLERSGFEVLEARYLTAPMDVVGWAPLRDALRATLFRGDTTPEQLAKLRPAFSKDGTITAGNASSINDGAAMLLVAGSEALQQHGLSPIARIVASATHSLAPENFADAPAEVIRKVVDKAGLQLQDIDLFEINEAFAAVPLFAIKQLRIDPDKVNVNGGAVSIGHPIGASGARVLNTLLFEMQRRDAKKGLATLCIGGGMGVAMCLERD